MFHIVYTSRATQAFDQLQLVDLLKHSRKYNRLWDVTGILLYIEGKFIQVLEGDKDVVQEVYARVKKDPWHDRVVVVEEGESERRIFKNWAMGFRISSYSEFSSVTGFKEIDTFFDEHAPTQHPESLLHFLEQFYKQNLADH
ncbi:MAG: BLUF domain-containing protein [Cyclobacteriaceae bacterium]